MCAITKPTRTMPVTAITTFLPIAEFHNSARLFVVGATGRSARSLDAPAVKELAIVTSSPTQ